MRPVQPTIASVRNFSLWHSLKARVLGTPVFGTKGKPNPPPEVTSDSKMTSHLNGKPLRQKSYLALRSSLSFYPDSLASVFKQPLAFFSNKPMTGFHRDGYCRTGAGDFGNHAVAGVVSEEFLDYTAAQGNDLRIAGLTGGCKWCLCTSRWMEAFQGHKDGRLSKEGVPKVVLEATEDSALRKVDLDIFKQFAAKAETNGANGH